MATIHATRVRTEYLEGQTNSRLIAGVPIRQETIIAVPGHTVELHYFEPNKRFALDLWSRNEFGTTAWRVLVARTIGPGEVAHRLPHVHPAAIPLLDVEGATRAKAALRWLRDQGDAVEALTEDVLLNADQFFNHAAMKRIRTYLAAQGTL